MKIPPPESPLYQDEHGQWWGPIGDRRTRCKIKVCEWCGDEYVVAAQVAKRSRFCTKKHAAEWRASVRNYDRGPAASRWKGGRIMRRGYVLVYKPDHHSLAGRGTQRKYVLEHRLVMEESLGRNLLKHEQVHHLNGDRADNRVENLELWTTGHSTPGVRSADVQKHCPTCTCHVG